MITNTFMTHAPFVIAVLCGITAILALVQGHSDAAGAWLLAFAGWLTVHVERLTQH